jgi:hypothetical protein
MFSITDNFLEKETYKNLREYADKCLFKDEINPVDGVTYPSICKDIPADITDEIKLKLGGKNHNIFMRMTKEGTPCPHVAHHDGSMGAFSAMLYLFEAYNAGTALLSHTKTGIAYAPKKNEYVDILVNDMNNLSAWTMRYLMESKENRMAIFDAQAMHCATPIGGFGDTQENARIVLTVFFS